MADLPDVRQPLGAMHAGHRAAAVAAIADPAQRTAADACRVAGAVAAAAGALSAIAVRRAGASWHRLHARRGRSLRTGDSHLVVVEPSVVDRPAGLSDPGADTGVFLSQGSAADRGVVQ